MSKSTEQVEMVETYNLYLSLKRLDDGKHNGYNTVRWRRALWHAVEMAGCANDNEMRTKLREALKLP